MDTPTYHMHMNPPTQPHHTPHTSGSTQPPTQAPPLNPVADPGFAAGDANLKGLMREPYLEDFACQMKKNEILRGQVPVKPLHASAIHLLNSTSFYT